jgi:hypothetical protein
MGERATRRRAGRGRPRGVDGDRAPYRCRRGGTGAAIAVATAGARGHPGHQNTGCARAEHRLARGRTATGRAAARITPAFREPACPAAGRSLADRQCPPVRHHPAPPGGSHRRWSAAAAGGGAGVCRGRAGPAPVAPGRQAGLPARVRSASRRAGRPACRTRAGSAARSLGGARVAAAEPRSEAQAPPRFVIPGPLTYLVAAVGSSGS